ncbi:MAG: triosephosphate isomerase [Candidatus Wildermuthbacteria bacterium]|nr:triosephosphate isomerase [Candidatus Wildermuthbacteria bacterium]
MTQPLIIANWKMNPPDSKEAFDLASEIKKGIEGLEVEVVLCPPFVYIPQLLPAKTLLIGAQDCSWEQEGPFTGEISPQMLKNLGCTHVILGHSERRQLGETLEMVNKKAKAALAVGLLPVVCIGEEIEKEMNIVSRDIKNLILAYEPSWAISTSGGRAVSPEDMGNVAALMKRFIPSDTPILYGGSVDSNNVKSFLGPDLAQGVLVGAASLNAKEFIQLVKIAAMQ